MFEVEIKNAGRIQARLKQWSEMLRGLIPETAMREMAAEMRDLARFYVRKDTGSLMKSIRVMPLKRSRGEVEIAVSAGGYIRNPKTGKIVDYQWYQEYYHPYMRPAAELAWTRAADRFRDVVAELVE